MKRTAPVKPATRSKKATPAEQVALDPFPKGVLTRKDGPFYRQVAEVLRAPIISGALQPGQSLPREADLAERFGVSLITVRQALRDLESEGLIHKRAAKPAMVADPKPRNKTSFDFQSLAAIVASTEGRRLEVLSYRKKISERAQEVFGLKKREESHCLQAILYVESKPACKSTFYFAPSIGARLKRSDFDDVVVFRSVQRHLGIRLKGAHVSVRAEAADEALARQLDYTVGGPILVIEILYFSTSGEPVELTINRNRADLFSLNFDAPNDLSDV
jgi:GntR family transcriptional regulator